MKYTYMKEMVEHCLDCMPKTTFIDGQLFSVFNAEIEAGSEMNSIVNLDLLTEKEVVNDLVKLCLHMEERGEELCVDLEVNPKGRRAVRFMRVKDALAPCYVRLENIDSMEQHVSSRKPIVIKAKSLSY